jgi:hypothetical protein
LDVLSSKEAKANTQANMLQSWQYFKNEEHLYYTTPLYEKVFKELPDNCGKEILQVEGVKQACDEDLQEFLKRDWKLRITYLEDASTSSKRITLKWIPKNSRTGKR